MEEKDVTELFLRLDNMHNMLLGILDKLKTPTQQTLAPKEEKKMYPATCSVCGKHCTVPFKPGENSKVKCISCWNEAKAK